jgi:hypothetical protein
MISEKYKKIERLSAKYLKEIKDNLRYDSAREISTKVITHYLPQINTICKTNYSIADVEFDSGYNKHPHKVTIKVNIGKVCRFYLDEMFHNCGILVSHDTMVDTLRNKGLSYIAHCIKEDIAYLTGYSVLMYTDKDSTYNPNLKSLDGIGASEIYNFFNTRSNNKVTVRIKNINDEFNARLVQETVDVVKATDDELKSAQIQLVNPELPEARPVDPVDMVEDAQDVPVPQGNGIEEQITNADENRVVFTELTMNDIRTLMNDL